MRKAAMIGIGLGAVAVVATAGIATANAANGGPASTSTRPALTSATLISQEEAELIAAAEVDGTVIETRLDVDHGRAVWNVHLSTPTGDVEVKVDAETGVARIDDEDNADDADDADEADVNDDHSGRHHEDGDHSGPGRDGDGGDGSGNH